MLVVSVETPINDLKGMLVMLKRSSHDLGSDNSGKLGPRYTDPYIIEKVLSNKVTCQIQDLETGRTDIVNRNRLRLFKGTVEPPKDDFGVERLPRLSQDINEEDNKVIVELSPPESNDHIDDTG